MPSNKVWKIKPLSPLASKLALETGLSLLQAQLLVNRGISDKESAMSFLCLRLADIVDPMLLKGMGDALTLILDAVESRDKVTIFGDYDADGLTATALLYNFFSNLGLPVSYYIPDRLEEGYGLNKNAIKKISGEGARLIITVDCGSSNKQEIAFANSLGMKVVVTDHHQLMDSSQPDCPVINPHQSGCLFPFKDLAGVGVAFYLAVAIRACLREKGWFKTRTEPDLKEYLDFVALGTVADRVSLLGQNRILVNSGMEIMAGTRWAGMKAMKEVADIRDSEIGAEDLAFRLAPRLNAPGRIGDPDLGIQVLTTKEPVTAKNLALRINTVNGQRQEIEWNIFDQIENTIETMGGIGDRRTLVLGSEDWHKGVLGIVASKLVDKYYRPTLVYSVQDGLAVGSGRSIDGFNLFRALSRFSYLFKKFGGHAHAAGFTLKADKIKDLERELEAFAREILSDENLVPAIDVDAVLPLQDLTPEIVHQIRSLSPFGQGNPEPIFMARFLDVLESRVIGERHLKLRVRQKGEGRVFGAIGFGLSDEHPLEGKTVDMVFTPEINRWKGYESIQLRVVDLRDRE
ncbi:MAG: single-stranded-DNA-specific exonuclease RecJ [Deltaproteobacteria bacterium]|nr:single-stranded-DNA-specific exonuclease RecJ [Deltaproteobacteria bacterium]